MAIFSVYSTYVAHDRDLERFYFLSIFVWPKFECVGIYFVLFLASFLNF